MKEVKTAKKLCLIVIQVKTVIATEKILINLGFSNIIYKFIFTYS